MCCSAGDPDTEGETSGTAAIFEHALVAVSDVGRFTDSEKLGGGGYLTENGVRFSHEEVRVSKESHAHGHFHPMSYVLVTVKPLYCQH